MQRERDMHKHALAHSPTHGHGHAGSYHGEGELVSNRGHRYKGGWVGGKREGFGIYQWPDGARYEGAYWDGKPHGMGTRVFASGAKYVGEWFVGVMQGNGVYTYHDGAQYEGAWSQDMRHGFGRWSSPRGDRFEGYWVNDMAHRGKGLRVQAHAAGGGSIYVGDLVEGECHGFGIETLPKTGEVYEGWWNRGVRQGRGRLVDGLATGGAGSRFDGEFARGLPVSGMGKLIYSATTSQQAGMCGWYAGKIFKGLRHGSGVMVYPNGDIYDGEWKSNLKHGYGCMISGALIYEGVFVYDTAGEEDHVEWEDYLEADSTILQERVRAQVLEACQRFALPVGHVQVLCAGSSVEQLEIFLRGTLKPLVAEVAALEARESLLLARDDPEQVRAQAHYFTHLFSLFTNVYMHAHIDAHVSRRKS